MALDGLRWSEMIQEGLKWSGKLEDVLWLSEMIYDGLEMVCNSSRGWSYIVWEGLD